MYIQTSSRAPGQIASAQVIQGQPTVLATFPPPGWKLPDSSAAKPSEPTTPDRAGNAIDEEKAAFIPVVENDPVAVLNQQVHQNRDEERSVHIFSRRKIYNSRVTNNWIVRHGESLLSPPPEVDARHCSGPAIFINVPPSGEKQIWLWNVQNCEWGPVGIGHVLDLDVKRELTLSDKNVPVFKAVRERQGPRNELRFIRCQPDNM